MPRETEILLVPSAGGAVAAPSALPESRSSSACPPLRPTFFIWLVFVHARSLQRKNRFVKALG